MSRKKTQPKKIPVLDSKFKSAIVPKLINSIMYDGKKAVAEKIIYTAFEQIKKKTKKIFGFNTDGYGALECLKDNISNLQKRNIII